MKRALPVQSRKVLEALTDVPLTASGLAIHAGLPTKGRTEAAAQRWNSNSAGKIDRQKGADPRPFFEAR
ncbi:hypothetical protein [Methylobacterium durans]|uniref:Uncharacterized protein n=1 Tax=Methylobacterium durans TaxID=2202825 RepID=A0A2U8W211_9HYPH|nr:hypothetical protein [Methylobacterium durans]AWN40109.1 hypothetical protein DK389_05605 [Methylobacterium durans]